MDTAEKGVVYFAFGSVVKASLLCNRTVQAFLTVFKELDQIILWKSDINYTDFDIPKNVYIRDHFDQISILGKLLKHFFVLLTTFKPTQNRLFN